MVNQKNVIDTIEFESYSSNTEFEPTTLKSGAELLIDAFLEENVDYIFWLPWRCCSSPLRFIL